MPDYPVELSDPSDNQRDVSLVVQLNKLPKQGSWFDVGDGVAAQVKQIRMIGGEPVIFAAREATSDRPRLKSQK